MLAAAPPPSTPPLPGNRPMPDLIRRPQIIRSTPAPAIVADDFARLVLTVSADAPESSESAATVALPSVADAPNLIVPLAVWRARRDELLARLPQGGKLGVSLAPGEEAEALADDFAHLALIAVEFPKFVDGRGYTSATLLRRLGWTGEIRAVGDVLRDQFFLMRRCGIDAFALKEGKDLNDALKAFDDFSFTYAGAVDDPRPLFRRVQRGGASLDAGQSS